VAKYLANSSGTITEVQPITTSAGAGDASKIPQTDSSGRLDTSLMPVGIGADTNNITTSEALAAGDFVNIWNSTGAKARKADASTAGKEAHGFVLAAVGSGQSATIYSEGTNTQVTGMTAGVVYLSASTPGQATSTPPSGAGQIVQRLGVAVSTTAINFQQNLPITLV